MCGIVGIWQNEGKIVENELINRMLQKQQHRGPDYCSYWIDNNKALGHNRLKIIDLSPRANQPMWNIEKTMAIVFNGEIYNFQQLKNELISKNYLFQSDSDTEVILLGYHEFGCNILSRINGMFAFCIYDKINNKYFIARDRFGKKPLYYSFINQQFIFASELQTLLEFPNMNLEIDSDALNHFLTLQYIPPPFTIYKNIRALQASEYLIFDGNKIEINNYYQFNLRPELIKLSYFEAKKLVREAVFQSVEKRMMADVPLGCFLSGGIDSSIITACLAQLANQQITTVSVGFDEQKFSELDKARTMAKKYHTNHHEYVVSIDEAKQNVEKIVASYAQPFGDSSAIPTYFLSKVTKQQITVALSGDGGDELFMGYQRYHLDRYINTIQKLVPDFALHSLFSLFNFIPPKKNVPIEANWLLGLKRLKQVIDIDRSASIIRWGSYFNPKQKSQIFGSETKDLSVNFLKQLFENQTQINNFTTKTQIADLFSYPVGDYLVKTDIAAMQHALEVRCPLLDYELAETVLSLNNNYLHSKGKGKKILRDAFAEDITPEVLYGPKRGFGIPVSDWFRGSWLDMLKSYLSSQNSFCKTYFNPKYIQQLINEHLANKDDHSKRLYLLLVLEIWNSKC